MKTRGQELAEQFVAVVENRDDLAAAIDAAIKAAFEKGAHERQTARGEMSGSHGGVVHVPLKG